MWAAVSAGTLCCSLAGILRTAVVAATAAVGLLRRGCITAADAAYLQNCHIAIVGRRDLPVGNQTAGPSLEQMAYFASFVMTEVLHRMHFAANHLPFECCPKQSTCH